ncbi:UNVERIFIED_CONTAM: hypothetical protein GTU68_016412 [Idotea baltica]|nr:hypothetical protein [Idotea baltica]
MADKGHAVGRTSEGEIVILLGGTVPGDTVNMRVHRKKKGLKHGYVMGITEYSKDRVEAKCQHFGTCGGCKWQHLDYKVQGELKERTVRQVIRRIAKDDEQKVEPIRVADKTYLYRNKLEYSFSTKRWLTEEEIKSDEHIEQRRGFGFHIAGAFDKVLEIQKCHLQDDFSNTIRNTLRELAAEHDWSYYDIRKHVGLLRNVVVRNSTLGEWMITIVFGENQPKKMEEILTVLQSKFPEVTSWNYILNTKANSSLSDLPATHVAGTTHITEVLGDIKYRISPKSFFQTNSYQAKALYDIALSYADIGSEDIVYDLYTGTGSIALYLAKSCKSVVGIEVIEEAIEDAKINAESNDIDNATFLVGDCKDVLDPSFATTYGAPDVLITDPPRAGMHQEVIETLLALAPPKIVYISCNPSTQARDILLLKEAYDLVKVTPVDMFPHTSHIESVALLKRR